MKKSSLLILLLASLLLPTLVSADTIVSGAISSDTTWSPIIGGVYIIDSGFSILSGVTLTIEPGTIIKARTTAMGGPSIYGTLRAQGTSELPIYFTSFWDDSVGGDTDGGGPSVSIPGEWQGLYFKEGSVGELDHIVVQYSGNGGFGWGNFVGIENDGGELVVKHSNLHDNYKIVSNGAGGVMSAGAGIYNKKGTLSVSDSVIENNVYGIRVDSGTTIVSNTLFKNNADNTGYGPGYGIYASGPEPLTLLNNTFSGNRRTGYVNPSKNFIHTGNTSNDQTDKGFDMSGSVSEDSTFRSGDLPYIIQGMNIEQGKTLTIEPGSILKMNDYFSMGAIWVNGNLLARGADDQKIYITSLKDDSVGGDTNGDGDNTTPGPRNWNAIYLEAGARVDFDNVVLRYGGFNFNGEYLPGVAAAIYHRYGEFSVSNSVFEHNWGTAIFQDAGIMTIDHSEFRDQPYGVWSRGGNITISQSSIHDNAAVAIYNESGQTIDARNNWWGSADGPQDTSTSTPTGTGDRVSWNVLYDPWLTSDPLLIPTRNPVIIVPGIMGSSLLDINEDELWPAASSIIFSKNDVFLDSLILTLDGSTSTENVILGGLIDKVDYLLFFTQHYFDYFLEQLRQDNFKEGESLFEFPYDWRFDISKTAGDTELNNGISSLKEKIDEIKSKTGAEKVDIVAHSMGGLLVKKYLKDYGGSSVDKFIDIATPHYGSPKSFKILNYGDDLGFQKNGFNFLNPNETKNISQNMPSVYQLLPSSLYGNYIYDLDDLDNNGVRGLLSYTDTKQFMKNTGRNSALVDRADVFHQGIAGLNPADYGVETYNIVGCGVPTLGKIFILNKETSGDVEYNISYTNGDGTVPLKSAESIPSLKTYYAKNAVHATMPSTSEVKELIADILMATSTDNLDISPYPNLAESSNGCTVPNGKIVSFHSPIELHIYSGSNHTGPNIDEDIENNIPGVSYEIIDGNKFAFLPDGVEYMVKGIATDDGTFNARVETIQNEVVVETKYFNTVPLAITTQIEVATSTILVDNNADGIVDAEVQPSAVLNETQSGDITKPITTHATNPTGKKDGKFDKPVTITLSATDDNSGVLKTEYSLNNTSSWIAYTGPFTIGTKGETKVYYRSTDRAGNVEILKSVTIIINPPGNSGKK